MADAHFDLDVIPERDRLALFHEMFGRQYMKADITHVGSGAGDPIRTQSSWLVLPEVQIAHNETTAFGIHRNRHHLADAGEDIVLAIHLHGGLQRCQQGGREAVLREGDATLWGTHITGQFQLAHQQTVHSMSIAVPRAALARRIAAPERALARTIARDTPALKLLRHYVNALAIDADTLDTLDAPTRALAAQHVLDMLTLLCDLDHAGSDPVHPTHQGGLRAARLVALKNDIAAHLCDGALSIGMMAARHGISVNYIGLLFKDEGTTFTDYVRAQRLRLAWQSLTDLRQLARTISDIAYGAGFNDVSYFNRAFRRQFGMSPSEARAAALEQALRSPD
jgi:AraC-like DNA-binding protein